MVRSFEKYYDKISLIIDFDQQTINYQTSIV